MLSRSVLRYHLNCSLIAQGAKVNRPAYKRFRLPGFLHSANVRKFFATTSSMVALQQKEKDAVMVRVLEQGATLPHQQWVSTVLGNQCSES